jgi:polyisoprenoid-binding protein YceI
MRTAPILLAFSLSLAACDASPTKDKTMADVSAAKSAGAQTGTPYAFSNDGSKVEFVGAKVTGKHDGSFGKFSGTVRLPGDDLTTGSVSVEIDMASLTTDTEKLTGHMKTADFFDVEKFPKAKFTSTGIKTGGEKGASHTVTGNFEIHGVTKSISFPATLKKEGDVVSVDAEFGINRKDFGVNYAGQADNLIKDEVLIKLTIKAKKS